MPYVCIIEDTGIDGGDNRVTFVPSRGNVGDDTIHSGVMVREIMVWLEHVKPSGEIEVRINSAIAGHRLKQFVIEDMELGPDVTSGEIVNDAHQRQVFLGEAKELTLT